MNITNLNELTNKQFVEEMKNTYEAKILALEQSLKKNNAESKFSISILSKAKQTFKNKLEEA